ncbi:hypothetical protein [Acidimangrovimonas sediminis]|uniref:hypothetical protein n=1 Tax=Acidimangrovimonas sediminis TaxID=2056283 RepID=UPI000C80ACA5|nr:hypothetical protein [Acidimangrovimonas sediminis]
MNNKPWIYTCGGITVVIGLLAGVLFAGLLRSDFGWSLFGAFLGGLIVFLAVWLFLRWAACGVGERGSLLGGHEAVGPAPDKPSMPRPVPAQVNPVTNAAAQPATPEAPVEPEVAPTVVEQNAAPVGKDAPESEKAAVGNEVTGEPGKPGVLSEPRGGKADDLKRIKGVGPKLEQALNAMGVYHLDQIAGWSAEEIAWVDENLEGFRGRVTRDDWVAQARTLAGGGETEFSQRVDKGGVYKD